MIGRHQGLERALGARPERRTETRAKRGEQKVHTSEGAFGASSRAERKPKAKSEKA